MATGPCRSGILAGMTGLELLDLIGGYAGVGVTTFVAGGAGAYLGSYLKKKGENLATHEDIGKLVDQMKAVTQATKEIEAQISDKVWNRQRRWDVMKDASFELIGSLSQIIEAATHLDSTYKASADMKKDNRMMPETHKSEAISSWASASAAFSRSTLMAELVCGTEVRTAMNALNLHIRRAAGTIIAGDMATFGNSLVQTLGYQNALLSAIRKELGIEERFTHLSSGSSAVQAPAPPAQG